jgi:hypothetical protein
MRCVSDGETDDVAHRNYAVVDRDRDGEAPIAPSAAATTSPGPMHRAGGVDWKKQ